MLFEIEYVIIALNNDIWMDFGRSDEMSTAKVITVKKHLVKVIGSADQKSYLSAKDIEMDARATKAVKAAIEKAEFCKKPVAKYDIKTKKAYIVDSAGETKYVE